MDLPYFASKIWQLQSQKLGRMWDYEYNYKWELAFEILTIGIQNLPLWFDNGIQDMSHFTDQWLVSD